MNVATVREQLAAALNEAGMACAMYRTELVEGFPAAMISIDRVVTSAFGDVVDADGTVTVLVSKADSTDAWAKLDELLSDNTMTDALAAAECVADIGAFENIGEDIAYNDGFALSFTISFTILG